MKFDGYKTYIGIIVSAASAAASVYLAANPQYALAGEALKAAVAVLIGGLGLTTYGAVKKDEKIKQAQEDCDSEK